MKIVNFAATSLMITSIAAVSHTALAGPGGKNGPPEPNPVTCNVAEENHLCATELNGVDLAILAATSLNTRDTNSLRIKVCEADNKWHLEKYYDAAQKLMDISDTITTKKKVDPEDAASISAAALAAAEAIIPDGTCEP